MAMLEESAQLGAIITALYSPVQESFHGFLMVSGDCAARFNCAIGIIPNQRLLNRSALLATIYRGLPVGNTTP
jgi:hypothetical protein